jgi:geranylgeranyl pyrophosphate synthase
MAYTRGMAQRYARQAQEYLACLPGSNARDILATVCERVVDRNT